MRKRIAGVLAAASAFAGIVSAAAPAAATSWLLAEEVGTIKNPVTAVAKVTPAGTVQVRHGLYDGRQYGWGRVVDPAAGYTLRFEIDLDGDRSADLNSARPGLPQGLVAWTEGFAASPNGDLAFRACITEQSSCAQTTYKTAWW